MRERRGPIARGLAWLRRAREVEYRRSAGLDRPATLGEVGEATAQSGPSWRREPPPLLPSHLPLRPPPLVTPEGLGGVSRRQAKRWRVKLVAWELLEWQIAIFNFWELGGPRTPREWREALGQWAVSPRQEAACAQQLIVNTRMCRPHVDIVHPTSGRGMATLRSQLSTFEAQWADNDSEKPTNIAKDIAVALPVDVGRVAICDPAGLTLPEEWLPPEKAAVFLDWQGRVRPEAALSVPEKACFMVSVEEEKKLRRLMLKGGMACLVPEEKVEKTVTGAPLRGGLFCVHSKPTKDRLIYDRRPQNSQEERVQWVTLPMGAQLCRVILGPKEGIRGSGDDLRTYLYCLRAPPGSEVRSALGRVITGEEAVALGGRRDKRYLLCLRVVAMGDHNAVDFAHETHASLLQRFGCMKRENVVKYGHAFPKSQTLEFLYIDDHIVVQVCQKDELMANHGPDRELVEKSHMAYAAARLARADDKAFGFGRAPAPGEDYHGDTTFITLGSQVTNEPGTCGAPAQKRAELLLLTLELIAQPLVELSVIRRALALFVHPFSHRKVLMGCFHRVYKWMSTLEEDAPVPWPPDIREEMLSAALLLPSAETQLRWPLSARLTTTDATPTHGGATETWIAGKLMKELYVNAEQRGCYVRLDGHTEDECHLLPAQPDIGDVCSALPWQVTRSHAFGVGRHINLQEGAEVRAEVRSLCDRSSLPGRHLNGTDSNVSLGSRAKGRSASIPINNALRREIGWHLLGQKQMDQFRLGTKQMPADDPSRGVPLRAPAEPEDWMRSLLVPDTSYTTDRRGILDHSTLPFGAREQPPQGRRLGDLLKKRVVVLAGARAVEGRWKLRELGCRVGRCLPDPCAAREWKGRSHWAWAQAWKALEADVLQKLASVLIYTLHSNTHGLDRLARPYQGRPQWAKPSAELGGEPEVVDQDLEVRQEAGPAYAEGRDLWAREHRYDIYGAVVGYICQLLGRSQGHWLVQGRRDAAAWACLQLPHQKLVVVDLFVKRCGAFAWQVRRSDATKSPANAYSQSNNGLVSVAQYVPIPVSNLTCYQPLFSQPQYNLNSFAEHCPTQEDGELGHVASSFGTEGSWARELGSYVCNSNTPQEQVNLNAITNTPQKPVINKFVPQGVELPHRTPGSRETRHLSTPKLVWTVAGTQSDINLIINRFIITPINSTSIENLERSIAQGVAEALAVYYCGHGAGPTVSEEGPARGGEARANLY